MRIVNRLFVLGLFLGFGSQTRATDLPKEQDTTSRKVVYHALISARPVVNWLQSIDTAGYFFNSPTQFEVQASRKKHIAGVGFNYERNIRQTVVNSVPKQFLTTLSSISPFYVYRIASFDRWKIYAGGGYMLKTRRTENIIWTRIERITENWKTQEQALMLLSRLNFKVNKRISIELEYGYYISQIKESTEKEFTLTPSMSNKTSNSRNAFRHSAPSNLLLKFSF